MKVKLTAAAALAAALAFSQTPTTISPSPILQFWDLNGKPLAGGQICVYQAGTTTPISLFKDAAGTMPWGNPITLDSSGRAIAYVPANALKYVLRVKGSPNNCASGSTLYTVDNVQDQGMRLRTDITGPNGLAMIPFAQPATPAVPTPGGAMLPSNLKMAQTLNAQDFELPDSSKSCGASTHDDVPAINAAINYAAKNGGGTVTLPPGRTCWLNSYFAGGVHSINLSFASNVTLDLAGAVFNTTMTGTTVALGMNTRNTPQPGAMLSYNTIFAASHDQWASPANDIPAGADHVALAIPANAAAYHKGDAIFIQSGPVNSGTPFNSEILVAASDGNISTGVVAFRDPTIHAYSNDGMNPWGLVNVEANTVHNLRILHTTSAKAVNMYFLAILQCVDCLVDGVNWDNLNGTFTTGQTMNLTLSNTNIHTDFTGGFNGSGMFQLSTGMTRTHLINTHWACTTSGGTAQNIMNFSEGSGATEVIGGELSGPNCSLAGANYTGVKIIGVKGVLNSAGMEYGNKNGFGLIMQGNDLTFTGSGSPNSYLAAQGAVISGNIFNFPNIPLGGYALGWDWNCGVCIISNNTVIGGGLMLQATDGKHSFSLTGNVFMGTRTTSNCIRVVDNGPQTVALMIANNYCSGFTTDLSVANLANEHFPVLAPNAFNDATPYSPAAAGILNLTGVLNVGAGIGTFAVADQGASACMPSGATGSAYNGIFTLHAAGLCGLIMYPGGMANPIQAPHGWNCAPFYDLTTPANVWRVSGTNSTSLTFTGTSSTTSELIMVGPCQPY